MAYKGCEVLTEDLFVNRLQAWCERPHVARTIQGKKANIIGAGRDAPQHQVHEVHVQVIHRITLEEDHKVRKLLVVCKDMGQVRRALVATGCSCVAAGLQAETGATVICSLGEGGEQGGQHNFTSALSFAAQSFSFLHLGEASRHGTIQASLGRALELGTGSKNFLELQPRLAAKKG